ncbi:MAG: 16S rRNA processing protein RimM [Magnetococcales bacterium]|nr:16S rRNA processing protein RimM [Magnetococcales bacterium]
MTTADARWLTLGRLVGSFGVHGEVRVRAFTSTPERLLGFPVWHLELPRADVLRPVSVVSGRRRGADAVVARLAEVATREEAQLLTGAAVRVERALADDLQDDEYYWADLERCRVVSDAGEELGRVRALFATGANDVMVLDTPDASERLLPFTREVVVAVSLPDRLITVRLMPGL